MTRTISLFAMSLALLAGAFLQANAQATSGSISGVVTDETQAVIANATVTARNISTNESRVATVDGGGRYRFSNLQVGNYEITVQANGFAKLVRSGIELLLNQDAVVNMVLKLKTVEEVVTVAENASLLNTANSEVSTRFDSKRLSELPLAPNRNVFNIALSAPGVSQLGSGQTGFSAGMSYSSNGGRVRSNNFMLDGQDINDPSVAGGQQPLNNPDLVQEVRLVTNQFAAEYGRNSGSVLSVITKSGTNQYHGSAFYFNNNNHFNSCSNLDKAARPGGFCNPNATTDVRKGAPFRLENQFGGTFGGPVRLPYYDGKDKTWFFGSLQRWTDRQLGAGFTLNGAPTDAGRQVLQQNAGSRPQVAALLRFLPGAQTANGKTASFTVGGDSFTVPLGNLTGSTAFRFDDWQGSGRIDHQFNANNRLSGRYLFDDSLTSGTGQATPPGLTTVSPSRAQSATVNLTSLLGSRWVNDARIAWSRFGSRTTASDPSSQEIPSIEIDELGLRGFNAANNRTAIGLAVNLPQFRFNNTYQIVDTVAYNAGNHGVKFGTDIRRTQVKSFFVPTIRGRLAYPTLQNFIDDVALTAATVNRPLPGGSELQYYDNYDYYFFGQDEWKIAPSFTLSYGLRYELPGNTFNDLVPINDKIVAAAGGDTRFGFTPVPKTDKNNFQPRLGFSWNPRTSGGLFNLLTGGEKLVVRGGYARTNDAAFLNINLNIASAFPFVASINVPAAGAFSAIGTAQVAGLNPNTLTRTIVGSDFRAPSYDQFSLEVQRELSRDMVLRVGYVGTKGTGLFQTVDGNPRTASNVIVDPQNPVFAPRVDPTRGIFRLRNNAASSIYHSMQVSLDKRLSRGFSAGVHYTWSAAIDTTSEIFNPSTGEVAVAQDSFDLRSDRARSTYDRPHRFTGNAVYELPFYQEQKGALGHVLGGWQLNAFFTLQSGAPFTPLNGSDPTGALNGIDSLVGNSIRPDLNTTLDISSMSIIELLAAGGANLFRPLPSFNAALRGTPQIGKRIGNAGRNILRADGIQNLDFGILKNTTVFEGHRLQFRADMFNATNTRNFGIPNGTVTSGANFLNQWNTNGGARRIVLGLRYTF
ncbi:MAG TPA: carboxypeptidase-like regulatory domain-containing protein [Blastocatellia bacterium]|nr:carboxypeptidase-like regulatory domain-containing protein [Blastocatellia bacterium]